MKFEKPGYCLNCETELAGKFCHGCGQKASTHRISFGKFLTHDLAHGLFHLDKGIFYTLRLLIFMPGNAARGYLAGKRVNHYNIFALFLIIVALKTWLDAHTMPLDLIESREPETDAVVNGLLRNYYKVIYLLFIPVISLLSRLFFSRLRYNYAEHMVAGAFALSSALLYAFFFSLLAFFLHQPKFILWGLLTSLAGLFLPYYQLTKNHYHLLSYVWRAVVVIFFSAALIIISLLLMVTLQYENGFEGVIGIPEEIP